MRKFLFSGGRVLLMFFVLMFVAAGCSGDPKTGSSEQVVLKFWKPFEDSENIRALTDEYESKHPNVRIEYTKKNIEDYESDLVDALASGEGPDVFSINNNWLPKYINKITPAPDKILTFRDFKESFVDVVVQDFSKQNKVYGVSLAVDSLGLYYNKDLLGTVGIGTPAKTWDELSSHVQRLSRQDKTGYFSRSGAALGMSGNVNRAVDIVYLLMLQAGAIPWDRDGLQPTFAQSVSRGGNYVSPTEDALDFYTSFATPSSENYTWNARSDYSIDSFVNGRAAYLYSYAYTRDTIAQKAPGLNYDVASVPQINLEGNRVNFANYFGEVVSRQSKHADVAWDFLKFISSKDSLDKYYAVHKQPSSRKDLVELQASDPDIGVFANANLTARSFYKPDQIKVDRIFADMIDDVVLRGSQVSEAVQQAESKAGTIGGQ
jgi:multiple sugar transport system substrate-binding protein